MRAHHDQVKLVLLREGGDFIARIADEADFSRLKAGLLEKRTKRIDRFSEFLLLQLKHFALREGGERHASHIRHHGTGVVIHNVDQIELSAFAEEVDSLQHVIDGSHTVLGSVNSDTDAESVRERSFLAAEQEHRALRAGEHTGRDGTHDEPLQRGKTAGTHDDQIGRELIGFLGDHFIRGTDPISLGYRNVVALQNLAGRSENLVGLFFVVAVKRFASYEAAGAGGQRNLNVQQLNRRIIAQNRSPGCDKINGIFAVFTAVDR